MAALIRECVYCSGTGTQKIKQFEDDLQVKDEHGNKKLRPKLDKNGKRVFKEVKCKECINGKQVSPALVEALELLGLTPKLK